MQEQILKQQQTINQLNEYIKIFTVCIHKPPKFIYQIIF